MSAPAIVRIEGVTKRFGSVVAVDDVSLEIRPNEFFALLGPSGCGKTTLLRMLAGFERPGAGRIVIDGEDMAQMPPNRRPVNMVFQSYAVFPHMSVADNVAYGLQVTGTPGAAQTYAAGNVTVRDAAGATHAFLDWLTERRLSYSVGFTLGEIGDVLAKIPAQVWTPAYTSDGQVRDGAWIAELTGPLDLSDWPPGMRVIARKERPHPGAQLRLTDVDGHRITAFATNTRDGQLPDLELRHRRRARAEDRIRNLKDTGLANLPLHDFDQNRIWCALVGLAGEITAWMQLLAFDQREARRWEPKRLRYRIFPIVGMAVVTFGMYLLSTLDTSSSRLESGTSPAGWRSSEAG